MQTIVADWLFSDLPSKAMPASVVVPFENPDLHDRPAFLDLLTNVEEFRSIAIGDFEGRRIGVLKPKLGAPAVAMAIEPLAAAGARVLIGVGFCGGLQPQIRCGDFVFPEGCVRDDGTSERYVELGFPAVPDRDLAKALVELLAEAGQTWHPGLVWTTDAVLMETTEHVTRWNKFGCIGVDMETAALYVVSRLCGARALGLLVASDNPFMREPTVSGALSKGYCKAINIALKLAATFR